MVMLAHSGKSAPRIVAVAIAAITATACGGQATEDGVGSSAGFAVRATASSPGQGIEYSEKLLAYEAELLERGLQRAGGSSEISADADPESTTRTAQSTYRGGIPPLTAVEIKIFRRTNDTLPGLEGLDIEVSAQLPETPAADSVWNALREWTSSVVQGG